MSPRYLAAVIAISSLHIFVAGCGGNGESASVDDSSTAVPVEGNNGLKDENSDGIRDDVNSLIDEVFSTSTPVKVVSERFARGTQNLLDAKTEPEAAAAAEIIQLAVECTYDHLYPNAENPEDRVNAKSLTSQIEGATINSRERVIAYLSANELLGGAFIELQDPTADECF